MANNEKEKQTMKNPGFTTTISVDQNPEETFAAVNNVRGWWSGEIEGNTDKLGAEFTYRYKDVHRSQQKITEFVPGKRVVWQVLDSQLSFVKDQSEWTGTRSLKKTAKRKSVLHTPVWSRNTNASIAARTHGAHS